MKKVSIIGAGNVGATAARDIAAMGIVDRVILLDIKEGVAEGKAVDISQAGYIMGYNTEVIGVTNNYEVTKDSDVIVITSGIPRKPGMTREELVGVNSKVVTSVVNEAKKYSPNAIYLIVSNPMDTMTMATIRALGGDTLPEVRSRVIGMGGVLDSSRFAYYIQKALCEKDIHVDINAIHCYVIGGHGDKTMIPVPEMVYIEYNGEIIPLKNFLHKDEIDRVVADTMVGGATLCGLIGTSAWEAPAAGIAVMVKSIINDELKWFPCSVYVNPANICIGVRAQIGKNGVCDTDLRIVNDRAIEFLRSKEAIEKVNKSL